MDLATILLTQMAPSVIGGIGQFLGNLLGGRPQTQQAPLMTWEQAMAAAQAQLQPAMQQFDTNSMARGFYGQAPTDAYRNPYFAGQQTALANQLLQQEADMRLKQGMFDLNSWSAQKAAQQNSYNSMLNGLNTAWGAYKGYADLTGELPFTNGYTTETKRRLADIALKSSIGNGSPWNVDPGQDVKLKMVAI